MTERDTAERYWEKFSEAYEECVGTFKEEHLDDIWNDSWSRLMMWNSAAPPSPLKQSVWTKTAEKLGLKYWEGEPLSAFYSMTDARRIPPFPIVVALEHEYDFRSFDREIVKLLSVRCPLKVGITYVVGNDVSERLNRVAGSIRNRFNELLDVVGEDPKTEYLFLAAAVRICRWNQSTGVKILPA